MKTYSAQKRQSSEYTELELERKRKKHITERNSVDNFVMKKRNKKKNNTFRSDDNKYNNSLKSTNQAKIKKKRSYEFIIQEYEKNILQGPEYVCICCGGLFFSRSVVIFDEIKAMLSNRNLAEKFVGIRKHYNNVLYMCKTCKRYFNNQQPAPLALNGGLAFPLVNQLILNLNDLEERLIAPRIAFMKIKPLKKYYDKQLSIIGNVVNVPVDHNVIVRALPRQFSETETIQIKFMRRLEYQKPMMFDKISPFKVYSALLYLTKKELFKRNNIKINDDFLESQNNREIDFVVDQSDNVREDSIVDVIDNNEDIAQAKYAAELETIDHFAYDGNEEDTLLVAPGEGQFSISVNQDKFSEELTFLKIYGGESPCPYLHDPKYTYQQICKSEQRRFDNRCSSNTNKIFYSYKKLVAKKLIDSVSISLKKTINTTNLTAGQALDTEIIEKFLLTTEGQLMLRTIRSSPQFWQWKKMELYAMIRQLGCPSLFMTFSPAECDWLELIVILYNLKNPSANIHKDQAAKLPLTDRYSLISENPVTTARYFDSRMKEMQKFLLNKNGVFKDHPIVDHFYRIDFQNRGSPHLHMLAWLKNAPVANFVDGTFENHNECTDFIDKYITVNRPENDRIEDSCNNIKYSANIKYQIHNCYNDHCLSKNKYGFIVCKYGFPWPILPETLILEPYSVELEAEERWKHMKNYDSIRKYLDEISKLRRNNSDYYISFEEFLTNLGMDFDALYKALRCSISRLTVFLKRDCRAIRVNPYNKDIILRHRANMDIQFVVDPYGIALYVSAYMLKSKAVMSRLLKKCEQDMRIGNLSIKQKLIRLSNKFQNCSEVSAQECVYTLLSMKITDSSRDVIYVNTYCSKDRSRMLKRREILTRLDRDSTDIYCAGLLGHYSNRSNSIEDICLAEFAAFYEYYSTENYKNYGKKKEDQKLTKFEDDDINDDEESSSSDQIDSSDTDGRVTVTEYTSSIFIKQLKKDGYVKRRKVPKILRYKRYNYSMQPYNFMRTELMLYMPWRDETKEVEVEFDKIGQKLKDNEIIIKKNKKLFELVDSIRFDEAVEKTEQISSMYEDEAQSQADEIDKAHEFLRDQPDMNNEILTDNLGYREELEENYGYHAELDTEADTIPRIELVRQAIKFPMRIPYNELCRLNMNLNRKQHMILQNIVHNILSEEVFHIMISGEGGKL